MRDKTDDRPHLVSDEAAAFTPAHPDVETLEVILPDTNAVFRGKWLPASSIAKVFKSGVAFPFSMFGIDAWGREVAETGLHIESGDRDGLCWPVPGTLALSPGLDGKAAQVLLTMAETDGMPFAGDPRAVLSTMVDRFASAGLTATVAFELEFYLLQSSDNGPVPYGAKEFGPDRQNMYALSDLDLLRPFLDAIRASAEAQGIPADATVSEAAPGQFEVNLFHRNDALRAADDALLLRHTISRLAVAHGYEATFMAKPFADWPGNGMHVHMSLSDADGPIFARDDGEDRLGHAVAGVLETLPEALLIFAANYNGFRRFQPGSYAPASVSWGHDNRSVAVRIPAAEGAARRFEHRIAGADANPYLVLTAILAGALEGLNTKSRPPEPLDGNVYDQSPPPLSPDMADAIARFDASVAMRDAFGQRLHHIVSAIKTAEYQTFWNEITALERETYL